MNKTLIALILGACCFMTSAQAAVINLTSSFDCAKANAGIGTCAAGGSGTGTGTMTFDTVTKQLDWTVTHSGLSGTVNNAHFHGPALPDANAGVQVPIGIANPAIGSAILTPAQEADMLAGLWYINIHSTAFPGGEIRGQVDVVPTFSLYDDFTVGAIDPTRWSGANGGRGGLETVILATGGALLVGNSTYGGIGTDAGRPIGRTRIQLTNTGAPGNLRALGASVTMLAAASQDCATNPDTGRARMQVRGMFFNDGASTGPGDATGDVGAGVQVVRDANGSDFIEWFVFRCEDPTCDIDSSVGDGTFTTNWTLGVPNFLFVLWDPANDQFVFGADAELVASPYVLADAGAPIENFPPNILGTRHSAENCAVGPPRVSTGFANFDNVVIGVTVPTP